MNDVSNTVFTSDKVEMLFNKAEERSKSFYTSIREKDKKFDDLGISYRAGQRKISYDLMKALKVKHLLVSEAGVGVGKTFAYLIPLLYVIDEFKSDGRDYGPVFISTSSISLQKQLMKDIKFLKGIMDLNNDISFNVALGMNNYMCLKKLDEILRNGKIYPDEVKFLNKLAKGIITKNDYLFSDEKKVKPYFESKIKAVSRKECSNCHYAKCQLPSILNKIKNSDIIIVNHQLLARYAIDKDELLKKSNAIIIDEGHNFEEAVRSMMTEYISIEKLYDIIDKANLSMNDPIVIDLTNKFKNLFKNIRSQAIAFNDSFNVLDKYSDFDNLPINLNDSSIKNATEDLIDTMKNFRAYLEKNNLLKIYKLFEFDSYINFFDSLLNDNNYIFSVETYKKPLKDKNKKYEDKWVKIKRTPKKISPVVERIVNNKGAMITSATIPNGIIPSLGISGSVNFPPAVPSPFDYKNNAIYYDYSEGLMNPRIGHKNSENYKKYTDDLAYRIAECIVASKGRSLVLFTNKKDTIAVHKKVEALLNDAKTRNKDLNIPLLIQDDNNKNSIVDVFKNNINSVLFSYGFWEGLDVPGESLSQVIITRLPFPVITPTLSYKAEGFIDQGLAMEQVYIPEMVTKLRQGFGRLIRKESEEESKKAINGCRGSIVNLSSNTNIHGDYVIDALNKSCPGIKIASSLKEVDAMFNRIDNIPINTPRIRTLKK